MRNHLPQKDQLNSHVVGDCSHIRWLHSKRNCRDWPITHWRKNAIDCQVVGIGRRPTVAEDDQPASTTHTLVNRPRRAHDLLGFFASHSGAQTSVILSLETDRISHLFDNIARLLLFLTQKWIQEAGVAYIIPKLPMLEENVHCLP